MSGNCPVLKASCRHLNFQEHLWHHGDNDDTFMCSCLLLLLLFVCLFVFCPILVQREKSSAFARPVIAMKMHNTSQCVVGENWRGSMPGYKSWFMRILMELQKKCWQILFLVFWSCLYVLVNLSSSWHGALHLLQPVLLWCFSVLHSLFLVPPQCSLHWDSPGGVAHWSFPFSVGKKNNICM